MPPDEIIRARLNVPCTYESRESQLATGDKVRFVLKHLRHKHPEILGDMDVAKLKMESIIKKYFSE